MVLYDARHRRCHFASHLRSKLLLGCHTVTLSNLVFNALQSCLARVKAVWLAPLASAPIRARGVQMPMLTKYMQVYGLTTRNTKCRDECAIQVKRHWNRLVRRLPRTHRLHGSLTEPARGSLDAGTKPAESWHSEAVLLLCAWWLPLAGNCGYPWLHLLSSDPVICTLARSQNAQVQPASVCAHAGFRHSGNRTTRALTQSSAQTA